MKYIVDLDALKDCLDFLEETKINGQSVACIKNVKLLIDRFPKEKYEGWTEGKDYIKPGPVYRDIDANDRKLT